MPIYAKLCWSVAVAALKTIPGAWENPHPRKLGLAGGLTERTADLGPEGRGGTIPAIEEINAGGGIIGRKSDLLIVVDQQVEAVAVAVDRRLWPARIGNGLLVGVE